MVWSFWGVDSVQVNNAGDFETVSYSTVTLLPNDTLGVYLHMQNSNANLSYQSSSASSAFSDSSVSILSGSGVAFTFGNSFYPRNWSGELFYHYGFNPSGDCVSPRIPVNLTISEPVLALGNDTILDYSQSLLLDGGNGFTSYLWSDGSTQSQLLVDSTNFNLGGNTITLTITDSISCQANDTILITFDPILSVNDIRQQGNLYFSPNPTNGQIKIESDLVNQEIKMIQIMTTDGAMVDQFEMNDQKWIDLKHLTSGIYFISFHLNDNSSIVKKIVLY